MCGLACRDMDTDRRRGLHSQSDGKRVMINENSNLLQGQGLVVGGSGDDGGQ